MMYSRTSGTPICRNGSTQSVPIMLAAFFQPCKSVPYHAFAHGITHEDEEGFWLIFLVLLQDRVHRGSELLRRMKIP